MLDMVVGFCGTRTIRLTIPYMAHIIRLSGFDVTFVVSGQDGYKDSTDMISIGWAKTTGIPHLPFPAAWDDLSHADRIVRYSRGKPHDAKAGHRRNEAMVEYVARHQGAFIGVWDGRSRGTRDTMTMAKARGLEVYWYIA